MSFDVKQLFTSIPQQLIQDSLRLFLETNEEIYENTRLNEQELRQLCQLCFNSGVFQYNDDSSCVPNGMHSKMSSTNLYQNINGVVY